MAGQVALGRVAIERKRAEGRCRHEEGLRDALRREDQEDRRQRQTHEACEHPERNLRCRYAHRVDAGAQEEHHAERCQHDHPAQGRSVECGAETGEHRAVAERGDGRRRIGRGCERNRAERGNASDDEAERHKVVNLEHVGAQALVDGGIGAGTRSRDARLIVAKVSHWNPLLLLSRRVSDPHGSGRRWRDSSMPATEYDASGPREQDPLRFDIVREQAIHADLSLGRPRLIPQTRRVATRCAGSARP